MGVNTIKNSVMNRLSGLFVKTLDEPTSPNTKTMYEYWTSLEKIDGIPLKKDNILEDLNSILPSVCVLAVIDGGEDYRVTLLGENAIRLSNLDFTGKKISELPFENSWRISKYKDIYLSEKPYFMEMKMGKLTGMNCRIQSCYLPFRDSHKDFSIIVGAFDILQNK